MWQVGLSLRFAVMRMQGLSGALCLQALVKTAYKLIH
jgi:hypothetical protein